MSRLNLSRVLRNKRFNRHMQVTRTTQAVNNMGRVEKKVEEFEIIAIVVPATAEDLDRLPEGDASRGVIKIWTETPLRVRTADNSPDAVAWDGSQWLITTCDLWSEAPEFYCCLCSRQEGQRRVG